MFAGEGEEKMSSSEERAGGHTILWSICLCKGMGQAREGSREVKGREDVASGAG